MLKNEVLIHLLEKLTALHDLADKKAYISLGVLGATAIVSVQYIQLIFRNILPAHIFWQFTIFVIVFTFFTSIGFIFWHVIKTLVPRTNSSKENIVFWGYAANKKLEDLILEYKQKSDDEIEEGLIIEYHSNASIAVQKFKHAKCALYFATVNIALFFIIAVGSMSFEDKDKKPTEAHQPIVVYQLTPIAEKSNDKNHN